MNQNPAHLPQAMAEAFARQVATWARASQAHALAHDLAHDSAHHLADNLAPGLTFEDAVRAVRAAAYDTSLATAHGHVCLPLADRPDVTRLRALLLASGVVGTPQQPGAKPLLLDDAQRLYLHRYFDLERRLARRLHTAAITAAHLPDTTSLELLHRLFDDAHAHTAAPGADAQQRAAVALALRSRLTVVSGGPGTGKTTTVVNLLACLLAQDPQARIALAAPTGKAAARLGQALRERSAHLPAALRARLPTESHTVHRLLGAVPGAGFTHHAGNRLAVSVLVVDEASMLDLALATRLLEAVPDDARIVLLGDKDQLAAVESGAVFADISARTTAGADANVHTGLAGHVVWLEHNFRFDDASAVGQLARAIQAGRAGDALITLGAGDGGRGLGDGAIGALRWLDPSQPTLWPAVLAGYAAYLDAVAAGDLDAMAQAWAGWRVLCAVHDGPQGVQAVNQHVTLHARARLGVLDREPHSAWFPGRPVMVLRNDPELGLFNGDIGLTLPEADVDLDVDQDQDHDHDHDHDHDADAVPDIASAGALRVWFPAADGAWRAVAPARLPLHDTAYAMTVHKAQGSEFDRALLLLPAQGSRVLTRELLYTAVTRVRRGIEVCASASVLRAAIAHPTQRDAGLHDRLVEAAR